MKDAGKCLKNAHPSHSHPHEKQKNDVSHPKNNNTKKPQTQYDLTDVFSILIILSKDISDYLVY